MLFKTRRGGRVVVETGRKACPPKLDAAELAIWRGKDAASWLRMGSTLRQYAKAYRRSYRSAKSDYAAFRRAAEAADEV